MNLHNIEISGLYGTFNKAVSFDPELSILVGINGSGKTSILNCIDWLLTPDLPTLASIQFKQMRLNFDLNGVKYSVYARQESKMLVLGEDGSGKDWKPIIVKFNRHPRTVSHENFEEVRQNYFGLHPEPQEQDLWDFFKALKQPLTVTLDRSITTESQDEIFLDPSLASQKRRLKKPRSPIGKVEQVTSNSYLAYLSRLAELNEILKSKLVISAFSDPLRKSAEGQSLSEISIKQIEDLEAKFRELFEATLTTESAISSIVEYFERAKSYAELSRDDSEFKKVFQRQFRQIYELAEAFDEYERLGSRAYEKLKTYKETVNSFFVDSGKEVAFSDKGGSIAYRFLSHRGIPKPLNALTSLSSGERQMIILLSFAAFVAKPNHVFVVDEPELSLHPKWQEQLISAMKNLSPPNTQLIVATHSPEIAADFREKCVVLGVSDS